jgi:hypothetical protein
MNVIRVFPLVWLAALGIGATAAANERDQDQLIAKTIVKALRR